uniref:WD_REPEATS_REGION domain-containing protein n=1 Tax=Macrostomum lignano TaxID=282301 RepID=A0A1I8IB85_9PLAT
NKPAEPYGPGFNPAAAGAVFLYHRLPAGGSLVICSHGQAGLTLWFLAPNVGAALPATAGGAALSGVRPSVHTSLRLLWPAERWPLADWEVTAATLVYTSGRLALGLQSGHIVLLTMMQWLAAACFQAPKPDPPTHLRLSGHTRAVTALLHPASLAPDRYNPIHLVSGAEDFSVALWDCESGSLIHLFCVHGGPVASLQLPPNGCQGSRLAVSVVSVAADHSVSLLNLRERRLLLLASRHLYPVLSVRWRPLEDLLVVHTSDNSAYVWQTEVPALDRIVSGPALEELLRRSEESLSDSSRSAAPLRVTKLRGEDSGGGRVCLFISRRSQRPSAARLSDASSSRAAVSSVDAAAAAVNATTGADEQALTLQVAQLLLSLIHSWGLDTGLDRTVGETLGLWPPRIAPCFGLVRSRAACLLCPNPPPHWETNRQLTTLHLLATTALAGALATARTAASFKVWPLDQPHRASLAAAVEDPTADNDPTAAWNSASLSPPTAEQRQAWGLTLTHHTVLLADLLDPSLFQQPCLLSLAGLYHTA